jgi:uncharacterized membrane protein YgdD (TMEM256/DUF423 family)
MWIVAGCILGFFGVVLGAFGAHALASKLSERALEIYHTATQYQMVHALALLALGLWANQHPSAQAQIPGYSWVAGTMIFSGSLYALAITDIKILGAITPIGGVLFLVGWASFALQAMKN